MEMKSNRFMARSIKAAVSLASIAVVSACSLPGLLQPDRDFNRRVYVGAGGLLSELNPDTSGAAGVSVDDSNSAGFSLSLGYDISNRFSVEGHYADLGTADLSPSGSIDYQVGALSALVYGLGSEQNRMRREGFSAFGRLGIGTLNNDGDGVEIRRVNDVHVVAGAGLEYGLSNGLAARAEFVAHETDASYVQLGLLYRFGARDSSSRSTPVASPVVDQAVQPAIPPEPAVETTPVPIPAPFVAEPVADLDADGIADNTDACPDTEPGTPVNNTGCDVFTGVVDGVTFLPNSDVLTDGAVEKLSDVAQTLIAYPQIRVAIKAHTDNSGNAEDNLQLSKRRALAVARYFVESGVAGSRLRPQAFGESEPRAANRTSEGRALNRRVEIEVIK